MGLRAILSLKKAQQIIKQMSYLVVTYIYYVPDPTNILSLTFTKTPKAKTLFALVKSE